MKVLITGGAGFIGSHIADAYVAEGLEVVILDNLYRGSLENVGSNVRFYRADVQDLETLELIFREERPAIVNHHAAQIDVRRSVEDPILDLQTNLMGSLNLMNLSVKYNIQRFIFASTGGAIYGEPDHLPAGENTPVRPLSPYGISKRAVELYLSVYGSVHRLPYVVLRYGNVFGPRQSSKGEAGVVAIFCEQMLKGVIPKIYGDGSKTRDYVEVSDVVRANLKALERGEGQIVNVASGTPTTDLQVFTAVREALNLSSFEPQFVPKRPGEVEHIHLDVTQAAQKLDWKPSVRFAAGVMRTADWFRRRVGAPLCHPGRVASAHPERRRASDRAVAKAKTA
jgi:UDP-glucose 4-epimerase